MKRGVIVFVMRGCSACHEYVPRFKRLAAPFHARGLPIGLVDVASPKGAQLGDRYKIRATPTTVVLRGEQQIRRIGAVADAEIAQLLNKATEQ